MNIRLSHLICIEYPEYKHAIWSSDLILFHAPANIRATQLVDEIHYQRSSLNSEDYDSLMDLMEAALDATAEHFNCEWQYMPVAGTVKIYDD